MLSSPVTGGAILLELSLAWVAWLVLAGVALATAGRTTSRRDQLLLATLTVGALALRLAAPAAPHDINPRIDEVFSSWRDLTWRYPHGLVALMRVVWAAGVRVDDHTVYNVVAAAGALSVPLVYRLTRALGGGSTAALAAAAALGGLGLHVRYSHTDAPQIVEILLVLVAALTVLRAGPAPRLRDAALVGLSLGLTVAMRPEGVVLPVLIAGWALLCGVVWPARVVVSAALLAAAVGLPDWLGLVLSTGGPSGRGADFINGHGLWTWGPRHLAPWNAAFVPTALGLLTLCAGLGRAGRRRAIATFALMLVAGALVANSFWSIGYMPSWCLARHQLRVLPWMAVLVGLGVEGLADRITPFLPALAGRTLPALAVLGVAASVSTTLPDAYAPFTISDEYAFIRAHLDDVPEGCTVTTLFLSGDRGLLLPLGLPFLEKRHKWADLGAAPPGTSCLVYYRSALCTSVDVTEPDIDRCAPFEAAHTLEPLAEAQIASRGWLWEHYGAPTVRVGYYRVTGEATAAP